MIYVYKKIKQIKKKINTYELFIKKEYKFCTDLKQ